MAARTIRITAGAGTAEATLDGSRTAVAIWEALPLAAAASTWGDEIYFGIGHALPAESPKAVVAVGDEIRPASPVNVFGRLQGDPTVFGTVRSGEPVRVERSGAS